MRIRELVFALTVTGVLAGLCSCATSSAPRGFLVDAEAEQTDTFGGWMEIDLKERSLDDINGELIAVESDTVFVLSGAISGSQLIAVSTNEIKDLKLRGYDPKTSRYATWTLLGTLTTPSHGIFMALSVPLWIIAGSTTAALQSQSADLHFPESGIARLRAHARFPNGMPEGLSRNSLRPKRRP